MTVKQGCVYCVFTLQEFKNFSCFKIKAAGESNEAHIMLD